MTKQKYIHHHPSQSDNDENTHDWYHRYNEFTRQAVDTQLVWKKLKYPDIPYGEHTTKQGHYYPHILPQSKWQSNIYPDTKSSMLHYAQEEKVFINQQKNNLLSSQICCFNFLYIFRENREYARTILGPLLPHVREITDIQFEDTGPKGCTAWLGEPPGGGRGYCRTSADVAVYWIDQEERSRVTYVEWKYTETTFGPCGGYKSKTNHHPEICEKLNIEDYSARNCYLCNGNSEYQKRRYWEHLEMNQKCQSQLILNRLKSIRGCPFRGPLNQLMRLTLLADYTQQDARYDHVDVVVLYFSRTQDLFRLPYHLSRAAHKNVVDLWQSTLTDPDRFRAVTVEEMLKAYDRSPDSELKYWRNYIRERYDV
ncbi:hypothetical protein ACFL27_11870 [candidate division CSSED10-310 bacterium]|uniref:Uncharacterized protein n=1 Tax=candidate division CSSED10-310 bacterium TaxID=2855610 RepID=A0ABV6YXE9_UNCC1